MPRPSCWFGLVCTGWAAGLILLLRSQPDPSWLEIVPNELARPGHDTANSELPREQAVPFKEEAVPFNGYQLKQCHELAMAEVMAVWTSVFNETGFLVGLVQQPTPSAPARPAPGIRPCAVVGVSGEEWHAIITPVLCGAADASDKIELLAGGFSGRYRRHGASANGTAMIWVTSRTSAICSQDGGESEWVELAIGSAVAFVSFRVAMFHHVPAEGMIWSVCTKTYLPTALPVARHN